MPIKVIAHCSQGVGVSILPQAQAMLTEIIARCL
jgi:hypothetical protein